MARPSRELCILFVDVGQGDATIVLPPKGEGDPIIFDCGRDGWEVTQQLVAYGIERLEAVVISHLDLDHVGGLATLLDAYEGRIGAVYFAPDRVVSDGSSDAETAKSLVDTVHEGDGQQWELREAHRDGRSVAQADDGLWNVRVIAPRASVRQRVARTDRWEQPNVHSAVLRVEMASEVVLIGGDAPLATWADTPADELSASVFRLPHHGGSLCDGGTPDDWSPERLYDIIEPEIGALAGVSTSAMRRHRLPP